METRKVDAIDEIHGRRVCDPYRWLEAIESDEVKEWIGAQNAVTRSVLDAIPLRDRLIARLKDLFRIDERLMPVPAGERMFFRRRMPGEEHFVLYVVDEQKTAPRVLVDPNALSKDGSITLQLWKPSNDGNLLAFQLSEAGNDRMSIGVMNVTSGERLPDSVDSSSYPDFLAWEASGAGFWYRKRYPDAPADEEKYHGKLYFHTLGTDPGEDLLVYGEGLPKEDRPWVHPSWDGRFLIIGRFVASERLHRTELLLLDLHHPQAGLVPIVTDIDAAHFYPIIHRNRIYIQTNHEAPNWKLMAIDAHQAADGMQSWEEVIPEGDHKLENITLYGDSLYVKTLENACAVLRQYDLNGSLRRDITFPTLGSMGTPLGAHPEDRELIVAFSSFLTRLDVYHLDEQSGELVLFQRTDTGVDNEQFMAEQVWFASRDGTRVPMFVIRRKDLKRGGNSPTVLYGYGGFRHSLTPQFMRTILPFVEEGGVFAIANLRGGGEFGEAWHDAGMRGQKQNVFDDCIAAAEWLIAESYTVPHRLALSGGSNGGLLVAAVMTQRPDLMRAVWMAVPVTDMSRFHLFNGGRYWIEDYGSVEEQDMAPVLLAYSPYHNVIDGERYPATLITTAEEDDRVHPSHAYKMAARLQEANASDRPILLRVETKAGHAGATALTRQIEAQADAWSFIIDQLDMGPLSD